MSYILLLDDDVNYAAQLCTMLEAEGLPGEVTDSPEAALERVKGDAVRLVVADFEMPDMNGAEFIERARAVRPDLPVILVSGKMGTPEMVRVANIGVTFVMEKPVVRDAFLAQVKRFLRQGAEAGRAPVSVRGKAAAPVRTTVGAVKFPVASAVARSALDALRTALAKEKRVAVTVDEAVHVPRLAGLAAEWFGASEDSPVMRISADAGPLAREDVAGAGAELPLLAVTVDSPMALEDVLGALGSAAEAVERILIVASEPVARAAGWFDKTAVLPVTVVPFPPVSERLEDIAAAFFAVWRSAGRTDPFPSELARAVLGYDWEGAPRQLGCSLRLFEALLRRAPQPVEKSDGDGMEICFRDVLPADCEPVDLTGLLKRAQTRFLEALLDETGVVEDAAERAGISVAALAKVEDVSELELLFGRG
ncbi:MAG: response regulator [Opitutales bacterium]|nr:response regulator [Opitutales bacterium]